MRRYNQGNLTVGGKMEKRTGENLTFDATAETVLLGNRIGDVNIEGGLQLKHKLLGKEAKIGGRASFRAQKPAFFMNRYHSTFSWWDNDFKKEVRTYRRLARHREDGHTPARSMLKTYRAMSILKTPA